MVLRQFAMILAIILYIKLQRDMGLYSSKIYGSLVLGMRAINEELNAAYIHPLV